MNFFILVNIDFAKGIRLDMLFWTDCECVHFSLYRERFVLTTQPPNSYPDVPRGQIDGASNRENQFSSGYYLATIIHKLIGVTRRAIKKPQGLYEMDLLNPRL